MMLRLVILGEETEETTGLCSDLVEKELPCSIVPMGQDTDERARELAPTLVLLHLKDLAACFRADGLLRSVKDEWQVPVIALLSEETARSLEASAAIDDFVISPWDAAEVGLRAERILARISAEENRGKRIECGDLAIYVDSCEVTVGGTPIALTFREYELLKFLASNRGRVFSREDLLSQVWGYDYLGGGRTVDVHIRRLRSKIEDSGRTFVETVRNVGYRFTKDM